MIRVSDKQQTRQAAKTTTHCSIVCLMCYPYAGVHSVFSAANPQGLVSWQLYCNGVAVASSKVFEYKQRPGESVAVMSSTSSSSLFSAAGGGKS